MPDPTEMPEALVVPDALVEAVLRGRFDRRHHPFGRWDDLPADYRAIMVDAERERSGRDIATIAAHVRAETVAEVERMFKRREAQAMEEATKNHVGSVERTLDTDKAVGWGRAARAIASLLPEGRAHG